jgi:ribosome-associated protein
VVNPSSIRQHHRVRHRSERQESSINNPPIDPDREAQKARSLQHAFHCAQVADEFRSHDVVVLDLTDVTPIVDYFVIATGTSRRQMHAVAEEADRVLSDEGSARIGIEGYKGSTWILQDYGDIVLHVFTEETRAAYDLEHLWADAKQVDWQAALQTDANKT